MSCGPTRGCTRCSPSSMRCVSEMRARGLSLPSCSERASHERRATRTRGCSPRRATRQVVFVGGATVELWITDAAAPAPRPTIDVIVEVSSRAIFSASPIAGRLWRFPTRCAVGCRRAWRSWPCRRRSSWRTKLEAFAGRGRDDYMGTRDFADVVSLLDGRAELVAEVEAGPAELRAYVAGAFVRHQAHPRFLDGVFAGLLPDGASQARAELIVRPRVARSLRRKGVGTVSCRTSRPAPIASAL